MGENEDIPEKSIDTPLISRIPGKFDDWESF
jgi:hypothetical protein